MTKLFEQIEATISSDTKVIEKDKIPIIKVIFKYWGDEPIKLGWDENFGRVLWDAKFVLLGKSETGGEYDTSDMRFKTSNTYPSGKTVELSKGDKLESLLDFTELPISYEAGQLLQGKNPTLILCFRDENQALKPISNELVFNRV